MFFKSIRFRLQLWYGLILVAVLTGFAFTAYQFERGRRFRQVDEELQRRVGALVNTLRQPPRERGPSGPPLDGSPPDDRPGSGRPRPERPPNNGPPGDRPGRLFQFKLGAQQAALFDEGDPNGFYYIVRGRNGQELARSTNAPQFVVYHSKTGPYGPAPSPGESSPNPSDPPSFRNYSMNYPRRECFVTTPPGETILVGRSVAQEMIELRHTSLKLAGVGGIILVLGLAGGWWIATRAIRPVQDISATALKISAGDLSQRIDVADTDSELGQLAGVLNSTFARLDSAFAQQTRFTADAAHELRTPVSVMLTQTQTALARERNSAEYRETIETCQRATQRMRRLIESLLALARLDAGHRRIQRTRFDLSGTMRDCIESITPLAAERGISIERELGPVECDGDAEQLAQVITNLLTNAIHYNKENGLIRVTLEQSDDATVLTVSDTGHGISDEDLPHIFERFYRAEKSRSSGRTGLGLSISKAIIDQHGGAIEVSSQPGAGARFVVRLPR